MMELHEFFDVNTWGEVLKNILVDIITIPFSFWQSLPSWVKWAILGFLFLIALIIGIYIWINRHRVHLALP